MPMKRELYPANWRQIAAEIKIDADWRCTGCGKQCRRPGESMKSKYPEEGHRRTLTVAHLNHAPADCRRENLRALCAPCHLKYDAKVKAEARAKARTAILREMETLTT